MTRLLGTEINLDDLATVVVDGETATPVHVITLTIDVPADDCERCPLFHDEANACEASDMRELEGAYAKRPDWCPLDKGPVLVQVRK
jgi:hypothetical protein